MPKVGVILNSGLSEMLYYTKRIGNVTSSASNALTSRDNNPVSNAANFIAGSSLRSSAVVGKAILSSMRYYSGMLKTGFNVLTNARTQIDMLKLLIERARYATGSTLQAFDAEYRAGLTTLQSIFDSAKYGSNYLFNHVGDSINTIRIGESSSATINFTFPDLRANALCMGHTLDIIAQDNTDPLGVGANLRLSYVADATVTANSTIAEVSDGMTGIAEFKTTGIVNPALCAGGISAAGAGGGLVAATADYGVAIGGYTQSQVVGSVLNTLQAVALGNTTAGTQANGTISAGPAAIVAPPPMTVSDAINATFAAATAANTAVYNLSQVMYAAHPALRTPAIPVHQHSQSAAGNAQISAQTALGPNPLANAGSIAIALNEAAIAAGYAQTATNIVADMHTSPTNYFGFNQSNIINGLAWNDHVLTLILAASDTATTAANAAANIVVIINAPPPVIGISFLPDVANTWTGVSSSSTNQGIANSMVSAFGNYLDSAIVTFATAIATIASTSSAMEQAIIDAQKTADELLNADVMESAAQLIESVQLLRLNIQIFRQLLIMDDIDLTLVAT